MTLLFPVVPDKMQPDQIRGWVFKLYDLHQKISSEQNLLLKKAQIEIADLGKTILGTWDKDKRLISLSLNLIQEGTYSEIVEVFKHEMAHQFVDEVLCRKDNRPHGELFVLACKAIGVSSKASVRRDRVKDKQVSKVEKLLALSTSMNQHEAELALAKAQELSFKYNIEVSSKSTSEYSLRPLGEIRKRIPSYEWKIMNILSEFYFVKTLKTYHKDESHTGLLWQFEIYGTSHNIDTAEYVYYFLRNNAELLWKGYKKAQGKSVSRMRNVFFNGLLDGFRQKLSAEQDALKAKYQVKRLIDPALEEFYHVCNPRISRRSVSYRAGSDVYVDGVKKGQNLKVKPGLQGNGSGRSGLFLTDKSM